MLLSLAGAGSGRCALLVVVLRISFVGVLTLDNVFCSLDICARFDCLRDANNRTDSWLRDDDGWYGGMKR